MSAITEGESQVFVGWICGGKRDVANLKAMGVQGKMVYAKGVISHCECSRPVLDKLETQYPKSSISSFTAVDEKTYQTYTSQFE